MKSELIKNALAIIPSLLKDNKGKWSSKRTITGVLVGVVANYLQTNPLNWMVVCFSLVAVLPLCLSFMESEKCDCNK